MTGKIEKIGLIGAGSWGTALACHLARKGFRVRLWAYEREIKESIESRRENTLFLPGVKLPENIVCTNSLEGAVSGRECLLFAVPSHVLRVVITKVSPFIKPGALFINAGKGIEMDTLATPSRVFSEVLKDALGQNFCVLSGPTFAAEIVCGSPSAATVASKSEGAARRAREIIATPFFKVFISHDPLGVEIGGALKNVIAIAAGISDGLGFGYNARAFLITRGLAEMMRIGRAMGADPRTLAGLSGMGDLVLTCTGDLSRNRKTGMQLAQGKSRMEIQEEMKMVAEGIKTAFSAQQILKKFKISAAIFEEIYKILYEDKSPNQALTDLLNRKIGTEFLEMGKL